MTQVIPEEDEDVEDVDFDDDESDEEIKKLTLGDISRDDTFDKDDDTTISESIATDKATLNGDDKYAGGMIPIQVIEQSSVLSSLDQDQNNMDADDENENRVKENGLPDFKERLDKSNEQMIKPKLILADVSNLNQPTLGSTKVAEPKLVVANGKKNWRIEELPPKKAKETISEPQATRTKDARNKSEWTIRIMQKTKRRVVLSSDYCIPWEAGSNKFASQAGMLAFGCKRDNLLKIKSTKPLSESQDGVIPLQAGIHLHMSQAGISPFGALRDQVPHVKYKRDQSDTLEPTSNGFLSKWAKPNRFTSDNNSAIGRRTTIWSHLFDDMRLLGRKRDRRGEGIIPRLHDQRPFTAKGTGAGIGGFIASRQVSMSIDGLNFNEYEVIQSKQMVTWLTGRLINETQEKNGGFLRIRDVVNKTFYDHIKSKSFEIGRKASKSEPDEKF